jgi:fucose permease
VPGRRLRWQPSVAAAYAAFAQIGLIAGVGGVLLPAQIADYGVGSAAFGVCFFTFAAGFILASFGAGGALARFGIRVTLVAGAGGILLAGLGVAARPPFVVFVALQFAIGYGNGVLESALNAHLTALPRSTTLLNRLHAFFGVGALAGPLLAAWMLGVVAWPRVWLVLALLFVPLIIAFAAFYPDRTRPVPTAVAGPPTGRRGLLTDALRQPAVLLAAVFLAVYVGLEQSVGSWGFSLLTGARGLSPLVAGYAVSGFWLGLTAGRLIIGPVAARTRRTATELAFACLCGVVAMTVLLWLVPTTVSAICGLVLLGACLGPVFPTTMALTPSLTQTRLVPTAIGIANGISVVGGALIPWLAGAVAQGLGIWTLLPFCCVLSLVALSVWWVITLRVAPVVDWVVRPARPEPGG